MPPQPHPRKNELEEFARKLRAQAEAIKTLAKQPEFKTPETPGAQPATPGPG